MVGWAVGFGNLGKVILPPLPSTVGPWPEGFKLEALKCCDGLNYLTLDALNAKP